MTKQTLKIGDPDTILATRKYVDETIRESLKHYALINSPAFIGTPNAPTVDEENNSEQLATTAFVQAISQRFVTPKQGDERYWKRDEKLIPDAQTNYQLLPSGLILQWGTVATPDGGGTWVTFPIAFPDISFSVFLTDRGGYWCNPGAAEVPPGNLTGFNAWGRSIFNQQLAFTGFSWFAIGR